MLPLSPHDISHCGVGWSQDRVSPCSPDCPETHSVDQAGKELRDPPASASQVLEGKVCSSTSGLPQGVSNHSATKYGETRDHPQPPGTGMTAKRK